MASRRKTSRNLIQRAAYEGHWDGYIRPRPSDGQRLAGDLGRLLWPLSGGVAALFLLLALTPYGWSTPGDAYPVEHLTLVDGGTLGLLWFVALALWLGQVAVAGVIRVYGVPSVGARALAVSGVCLVLGAVGWIRQGSEWTVEARGVPFEGRDRVVLARRWIDSSGRVSDREKEWYLLAEVTGEWFWSTSYRTLHFHDPRRHAAFSWVLRPEGEALDGGWRLWSPEPGVTLATQYDNACRLFHAPRPFQWLADPSAPVETMEEALRVAVGQLSPFLLLGPSTRFYGPDLQNLVQTILFGSPGDPGYPHRRPLLDARSHPNPLAQRAAHQLLDLIRTSRLPGAPRDRAGASGAAEEGGETGWSSEAPEVESWTVGAPEEPGEEDGGGGSWSVSAPVIEPTPTPSPTPVADGSAAGPPERSPPGPSRWVPPERR